MRAPNRPAHVVFFLTLCAAISVACSRPTLFDSDTASTSVRFSLAGATTSAGVFLCEEADLAQLTVAPGSRPARVQRRGIGAGQDCQVEFSVTVPRGDVRFTGELVGRSRPLMRGSPPVFRAEDDGFRVVIDLHEIDALGIQTRTLGVGGPATYVLEVDGSTDLRQIGQEDADTLAALAGGVRFVTLHPEPCAVVNGPAHREVMIPTDERELGDALFEIDCTAGGRVHVVIQTTGGGGPPDYSVYVGNMPPEQVGRRDSITVEGVTPGPFDARVVTGDPSCTAEPVVSGPYFLPTAGEVRLAFIVRCLTSGAPPSARPDPVTVESIRVVTRAIQPPLPGEIETFDVRVTNALGQLQSAGIGVGDSVTFRFPATGQNPQNVTLTPTGSCTIMGGISSRAVTLPRSGFARVEFLVGC